MQNFVTSDECSTKMSKHRVRCFVLFCFILFCFALLCFFSRCIFFFENFRFPVTRSLNNLDDNTTREISFEFLKAGKTWFPWVRTMGDGDKTWYWIIVLRWIVLIIHRPTRANFRIKVDLALGTTRVNVGLPNLGNRELLEFPFKSKTMLGKNYLCIAILILTRISFGSMFFQIIILEES